MIENLDYISKFMQKAANKYSNNDTGWLESVKKIGVEENDEQNKKNPKFPTDDNSSLVDQLLKENDEQRNEVSE